MKLSISKKIMMLVLIPILVICILVGVLTSTEIERAITNEIEDVLKVSAYNFKTEYGLTSNEELDKLIQEFHRDNHIDVTIFNDNTRVLSTIENAVGTSMDNKILNSIKYGEHYFATNANVNGESYFGYYIPIMEDGEYVGASFTGIPQSEARSIIISSVMKILIVVILCGLLASGIAFILIRKIVKSINKLRAIIESLDHNDLSVKYDKYPIEHDEIESACNDMIAALNKLNRIVLNTQSASEQLKAIASDLSTSVEFTTENSKEIAEAIEDVAGGSVSQAEETTSATHRVSNMSEELSSIKYDTDELNTIANSMDNAKNDAMNTLLELQQVNDIMSHEIKSTSNQVNITSESVQDIQKVVDVIKNIADETKLLSLNASIEAAKAGETGRGFAVVAENIRSLAEQSAKSSDDIENILKALQKNYDLTMKSVESTSTNMDTQNKKLKDTQRVFNLLEEDINQTVQKIININDMVESLDGELKSIVDVISNLSAISEENSASTQQITSSIQTLDATISQVYEKALNVDASADELMNEVSIFKTK